MASLTQWTWVWVNYRNWWWTGRLGMLQSIGSERVRHDWATELNRTDSILKSRDITLLTKVRLVKAMVFPVVVWMQELDYKESWALKNWCFRTVVLEKTLESPLDCKDIKLVNPKGNQSWIFIGRTKAKAPILWPPDMKNWLTGKDPDAGKDCGRRRRGWDGWMA